MTVVELNRRRPNKPSPRLPTKWKNHPFAGGFWRAGVGRHELSFFAHLVREPDTYIRKISRLKALQEVFCLYADYTEDEALRFSLATRRTFRFSDEGKMIRETGPQLVYSLGPTGVIAIMLFPAKSDLGTAVEDVIFLGIGRYSGGQMADRLTGDLRSLSAYGHVTAIDGDPTLAEIVHVWWLRKFHPTTIKGNFETGAIGIHKAGAVGLFAIKTIFTSAMTSVLRPVATILVLLWFLKNSPDLMALIPKGILAVGNLTR